MDEEMDFDFKSLLSNLDEPMDFMASPPATFPSHRAPAQSGNHSAAPPLHPMQSRQQTLSMDQMLDSKLFRADAPWSMGSGRQGLTAAPPPTNIGNNAPRNSRSGSGAIISSRLRAASDMHQAGFLSSEEKSLMKDLILSKNPKFKEEYANAERTNNWYALQNFLRSFNRHSSPANSLSNVIDNLATEFEALATPPPPVPGNYGQVGADGMTKAQRKRMASSTTPVARPKKTTGGSKRDPAISTKQELPEDHLQAAQAKLTKEDMEIEAAIAAADGDSEQVAKLRKNERERRRRLAVSNGFDELFELLKLPQAAQIDKVSILRRAIDRIKELEARVAELEGGMPESEGGDVQVQED